jgi:Cytochrome P460
MKSQTLSIVFVLAVSMLIARIASGDAATRIAYPDGYRDWTHVKSALMSPHHANYSAMGGFHHIYANEKAMAGYRSGEFPQGSIIVFDWLQMTEKEGVFIEGARRQTDVMVKDAQRFAATGGWGFQRFAGDSKTDLAPTPSPDQCFACHDKLKKKDLVLSSYRL